MPNIPVFSHEPRLVEIRLSIRGRGVRFHCSIALCDQSDVCMVTYDQRDDHLVLYFTHRGLDSAILNGQAYDHTSINVIYRGTHHES